VATVSMDEHPAVAWGEVDRPPPAAPRVPSAFIGAVAGVTIAGFLVWRGHATAAAVLVAVAMALLVVRHFVPSVDRRVAWALVGVGHVAGRALAFVALGLVMVLVVVPVWVLAHALRWDTLDPSEDHGSWAPRSLRFWDALPHRGFVRERRRPRRSSPRALAVAALPLALLGMVAFGFRDQVLGLGDRLVPGSPFLGDDSSASAPVVGPRTELTTTLDTIAFPTGDGPDGEPRDGRLGLGDAPWVAQYISEYFPLPLLYDSYLTVRVGDTSGEYVNVASRVRRSYTPPGASAADDGLDVWFFGSSALFGQGQRDDHTIPSEVARLAERDGVDLRVQNFGVPGYRAWQDAILMGQMLSERPAPDLIVMYEGFNDVMSTLLPGSRTEVDAGWSDDVRRALRESGAAIGGTTDEDDPIARTNGTSPENAAVVFNRSAQFARDIAGARGVPIVQFLQPSVWTRDLAVDDATLANVGADREWHDSFGAVWNQARALMAVDGVVDLGDSLDELDELVYEDLAHHNEHAARVVAEAMYASLAPRLDRLTVEQGADG